MAIYAFDGTGNEDNPGENKDTNVRKFFEAYHKSNCTNNDPDKCDKCFYVEGVGTRWSILGILFGSPFGAGGHERIDEALDRLEENFQKGDMIIDIVGFSRGAALALEFANEIHDKGVNGQKEPSIRFMGIWDTVASFGIPGNNINIGYNLTVPKNVERCCHAIALDERRGMFPLTRVVQDAYTGRKLKDIREVWFRGFHSDVGGGNENPALSSISLVWMFRRAMECGIKIDDKFLKHHAELRDPAAPCKKPGMDLIPNKKRTVMHTDFVHESVSRIKWAARRFEANNPPKGLSVVNDDGNILPQGFEGGDFLHVNG